MAEEIATPTVYVVDDSDVVRNSVAQLLSTVLLPCKCYSSIADFLTDYVPDAPGCLILDVRLPGIDGLALLESPRWREQRLPTIVMTGFADVPMAVRAMRAGVVDFMEKPYNSQRLLDRCREAIETSRQRLGELSLARDVAARLKTLTPREEEILNLLIQGASAKSIASTLSKSAKTIEAHRKNLMGKMRAENLADLVRMILTRDQIVAKWGIRPDQGDRR